VSMLDDVASDLAVWIDRTADEIARAMAPGRAPFAAPLTEEQKLEFYRNRLFNADGTPNPQGRQAEIQRLGVGGFTQVYKAVINRYPELKVPPPPEIAVPEQWPTAPAGPPGPPPGPPGPPPGR
jgi:hypothetical protein